jgi:hypothetical protein
MPQRGQAEQACGLLQKEFGIGFDVFHKTSTESDAGGIGLQLLNPDR